MIGEKFNLLKVIERSGNRNGFKYYLCECDCGNRLNVRGTMLRNDHTKSCGCLRKTKNGKGINTIDLKGKRFSNLIVIERDFLNQTDRPLWICKCDCGNTTKVKSVYLMKGDTKSCGCLLKKCRNEFGLWRKR